MAGVLLGCIQIFNYIKALLKYLQWSQCKIIDLIHSMVEIEQWSTFVVKN